jgi:ribA/ribD-fused uncharacterized protein
MEPLKLQKIPSSIPPILTFDGRYSFLSNFYLCNVRYDGILYPSSEHAYQAAKSVNFEVRKLIAKTPTPGASKKAGQQITLRPDWSDELKISLMAEIVLLKFVQNDDLREKLLETYPRVLSEGNAWGDTFWGVCNAIGDNNLGFILMDTRTILKGAL